MVFEKSMWRPLPSVSRPSSSTCSSSSSTSRFGLVDLVEHHHRRGLAAHGLGELAAFAEAHVAGRRADQARDAVAFGHLGHVDADHRVAAAEHHVGQAARHLGLAHAGGAQEEEAAHRAAAGEAGVVAAHHPRDAIDHVLVADDALAQVALHREQARRVVHQQPLFGQLGDLRDHAGHVLRPPPASCLRGGSASPPGRAPRWPCPAGSDR